MTLYRSAKLAEHAKEFFDWFDPVTMKARHNLFLAECRGKPLFYEVKVFKPNPLWALQNNMRLQGLIGGNPMDVLGQQAQQRANIAQGFGAASAGIAALGLLG